MQGSLLASFGFRTLAVLRAVSDGIRINDATKERLCSFGFATVGPDGTASLTIVGLAVLAYLESIALVPEDHVEFIEAASGRGAPKKASGLSR